MEVSGDIWRYLEIFFAHDLSLSLGKSQKQMEIEQ
jgi:hypothetical protein